MTPKEKAKELLINYMSILSTFKYNNPHSIASVAKTSALIAVNEIIYSYPTDPFNTLQPTGINVLEYWLEVKKEIELL